MTTQTLDFPIMRLDVKDMSTMWVDQMLRFYTPTINETRYLHFAQKMNDTIIVTDISGNQYVAHEIFEQDYFGSVCGIYLLTINETPFYIALAKRPLKQL